MSAAYLLIAHGSREERSNRDFLDLVSRFSKNHSTEKVIGAFLELAAPSIPEAIEECAASGVTDVMIVPLMLFWGRHVKQDIPKMIDEARVRHAQVSFHYAGPMADHPEFLGFLQTLVQTLADGRKS